MQIGHVLAQFGALALEAARYHVGAAALQHASTEGDVDVSLRVTMFSSLMVFP